MKFSMFRHKMSLPSSGWFYWFPAYECDGDSCHLLSILEARSSCSARTGGQKVASTRSVIFVGGNEGMLAPVSAATGQLP